MIRTIDDYVHPKRQGIVCKVHGSIDWSVAMAGPGQAWQDALNLFEPRARLARGAIMLNQARPETRNWTDSERRPLYPVLTAPLAGKRDHDLVCPDQHLDALREFLRTCGHYLIIGTSGQDEDLLAFLLGARPNPRAKLAHYVSDSRENAELTRNRLGAACPADQTQSFPGGFRAYLGSDLFHGLLAALS